VLEVRPGGDIDVVANRLKSQTFQPQVPRHLTAIRRARPSHWPRSGAVSEFDAEQRRPALSYGSLPSHGRDKVEARSVDHLTKHLVELAEEFRRLAETTEEHARDSLLELARSYDVLAMAEKVAEWAN
jgi:hypothetical protein